LIERNCIRKYHVREDVLFTQKQHNNSESEIQETTIFLILFPSNKENDDSCWL
jgi:hypothetical protein